MYKRQVQNLVSSFNAKYPDIKVTVEYLDYTNGDDQVNTAIEGGSAPDLVKMCIRDRLNTTRQSFLKKSCAA